MRNLTNTLADYDLHMLQIIANRWDVDLNTRDIDEAIKRLGAAMLNSDKAAHEWSRLNDQERGALQMVLGSNKEHKMAMSKFSRLFGEIRTMGADKRQREKPHVSPNSIGEILYYRGLVSVIFDQGKAGAQAYVYVPSDLAAILPIQQTGYDMSAPIIAVERPPEPIGEALPTEMSAVQEPPHVIKTNTLLVDDLTTVLAYLRIHETPLKDGYIPDTTEKTLLGYMLGAAVYARLDLILRLAWELELIKEVEGLLRVTPESRAWLEKNRTEQMETLIRAWHKSQQFNEIFHIPSLHPEMTNWRNNPSLLRDTLCEIFALVGDDEWMLIEDIIEEIKMSDPDFQRPGGNYDSWYIRDAQTNEYLRGFDSWNQVEGAMLRFTMSGPLHWLGLADVASEGEKEPIIACRLTAFGRAWVHMEAGEKFPQRPDPETKITLDGEKILAPRAISRFDRFQLARFTEWDSPSEPMVYRLTPASLQYAEKQGIKLEHILTFIQRTTGHAVSPELQKKLNEWLQGAAISAKLQRLLVLRLDSEQNLDMIWDKPNLRRYLSGRLGGKAVAVREDQWQELIKALEAQGIEVEQHL